MSEFDLYEESNKSTIKASQTSPIQLLFKSIWSELNSNGQSSKEQTQNCLLNISPLILSNVTEQSLFSRVIIHTKFFIPSPSISSSQISGIQSLSISHLYLEIVQFFSAFSQISTEFTWTVHWFIKAIHLFTSIALVNILSHAVI